eukprot:TRINITY_DN429_c0_g1_i2.p2 TRINITY_DN429_c0_g1~~TRINITY_DN429_c0_g1_i2.p2  ORF type:complete len:234 (+),score=39.42 TRINITY_DN429_c0_g1_i2:406-1107(+)
MHVQTPCILSTPLSNHTHCSVYLKLENTQTTASFKLRGIGTMCLKAVTQRGCTKLISSSGGNAGLAVAFSGRMLKVPVTVVVPVTTSVFMQDRIQMEGATVIVDGDSWLEANETALTLASEPGCELIHPFDHQDIWDGHQTMMEELASQMTVKPDCVITVVGGGGLLCGVCQGMHAIGWDDVPIIVSETEGASSFADSVAAGELVKLDFIDTIANTLGAKQVCSEAFEWSKKT